MDVNSQHQGFLPEIVFNPTLEEFINLPQFLLYMKSELSKLNQESGIAKIIPPEEYKKMATCYENDVLDNIRISDIDEQTYAGENGYYSRIVKKAEQMDLKMFRSYTISAVLSYAKPKRRLFMEIFGYRVRLVRRRHQRFNASLMDANFTILPFGPYFNFQKLDSSPCTTVDVVAVVSISRPSLDLGSYKSTSAWKTDEKDVQSVTYVHCGGPIIWYAIPSEHLTKFAKLAEQNYNAEYMMCAQFLKHNKSVIDPTFILASGIPLQRVEQYQHEIVVNGCSYSSMCSDFVLSEKTKFVLQTATTHFERPTSCTCRQYFPSPMTYLSLIQNKIKMRTNSDLTASSQPISCESSDNKKATDELSSQMATKFTKSSTEKLVPNIVLYGYARTRRPAPRIFRNRRRVEARVFENKYLFDEENKSLGQNVRNKCNICSQAFESPRSFLNHVYIYHIPSLCHICSGCAKPFPNAGPLNRHKKTCPFMKTQIKDSATESEIEIKEAFTLD